MTETPLEELGQLNIYQMALFGNVLNLWAQTEIVIEMVIKDALKLSTRDACIVCGPLGGGAKVALLKSLMAERGEKSEFVQAVTQFQTIVSRNSLAHGFPTYRKADEPWFIVSREVKDKLTVRTKPIIRYLEDDVMPAFDRVVEASGFSDDDMHRYGLEIADLAQRG